MWDGDFEAGEEGEMLPTSAETLEVNKEMSYRETVMSICSFMGWSHIPDFDLSYGKD